MKAAEYRVKNRANSADKIRETVIDNIVGRRNSLGLSQRQLAMEANVTQSYLAHLECGRRDPNIDMICRLADALGVTFAALLQPGAFHTRRAS